MSEKVFLPIRRGAETIVFAYVENAAQRRWQFHAVACTDQKSGKLTRLEGIPVTADELAECEKLVASLKDVEFALAGLNLCDASTFPGVLNAGPEAQIIGGSMLFTSTMYLNFLRQYLVEESAAQRYANRDPKERFDVGLSASIYDGLLKRHELITAEALLDADLPHAKPPNIRHREWAYLYRRAAEIKIRMGRSNAAISLLNQAGKFWPRAEYQRRIANLHFGAGELTQAIAAMKQAHLQEPLTAQPLMKLAHWLKRDGDVEAAKEFAGLALQNGATNAQKLLDEL